jgi:radical SAM protein with 4Fe4S-binding SPASM domain
MTCNYVSKVKASGLNMWKNHRPLLSQLDIELTERCNNNCIHCFINLPADDLFAQSRELSTENIKKILKEAAFLGALTVRFSGGEPLLRDDFEELYLFARKLGLRVLIFTNGRLITAKLADLFSKIPPLQDIEVTVYGMTQESYEAVSGVKGSFKQFRYGLDLLLGHQIPFVVKGAILPQNRHEIELFEDWASTIPWMEGAPEYAMFFDLRGRRNPMAKNRIIENLRISPKDAVAFFNRRRPEYIRNMTDFCSKFMHIPGENLFTCGAGKAISVDAYGFVQPCLMLRHPEFVYDLNNGSLKDALTSFFPSLRQMKATNPDYLIRCAKCFLKGLCEQCPAKSWEEYGTLDTPVEYLCQIAHSRARDLGLIKENENAWNIENCTERIKWISI